MSVTPGEEPPALPVEGTRFESVDDIRRALAARRAAKAEGRGADAETRPFRPARRPPTAMLCVLDDPGEDGEWFRIRATPFVIGRGEGDVTIPHDAMMSGRHAEITRVTGPGRPRWYLSDLGSTNGSYVRVGGAVLKHGQEFILGSGRYRFDAGPAAGTAARPGPTSPEAMGTQGWHSISPASLFPSLVELTADGEGRRTPLATDDAWVGRDPGQCSVVLPQDMLVSPRHARLFRDEQGVWHVENAGSLNGVWLRVGRIPLSGSCQFRLGEQRFLLRIP